MKIPLVNNTIDHNDINSLIDWLKTYPHLTKGEITAKFEQRFANELGCKYAIFVNSGSSAIMLALYVLIEANIIQTKCNIVIPAVSWSTDLAPVVQLGFNPILCDCNLADLSIDISHLQQIITESKIDVLILVSPLGLVPQMDTITELCKVHNIIIIEDVCESLGSKFKDKKLGTFGLLSVFSTYFGHHMSTIEGGLVCTDNEDIYNILLSLRSHGWDRDMGSKYKQKLRIANNINDFKAKYTFYYNGFNFRPTEIQSYIGLLQLQKLPTNIIQRNDNYKYYNQLIDNSYWKAPDENNECYISNFAYPIISPHKVDIIENLQKTSIECRPLICGSLCRQPFWKRRYTECNLPNANIVDNFGFYVPNNHCITKKDIKFITKIVNDFPNN